MYPELLLHAEIRRSTIAGEASAMSIPLPVYASNSPVTEDFNELATELAERIGLVINPVNVKASKVPHAAKR